MLLQRRRELRFNASDRHYITDEFYFIAFRSDCISVSDMYL